MEFHLPVNQLSSLIWRKNLLLRNFRRIRYCIYRYNPITETPLIKSFLCPDTKLSYEHGTDLFPLKVKLVYAIDCNHLGLSIGRIAWRSEESFTSKPWLSVCSWAPLTCEFTYWSFDRKTYTWSSRKSSHSWNPADFMKSGGFHHEIRRISWNPWNPADFMKSGGFHPWNPADFTREIRRISWNPPDFMKSVKSGGFHPEIRQISWNPADFMKSVKSGGFHPWNPADFTQISPVKSTQNYKSKCFSKNSSVLMNAGWGLWPRISWNSPWNLVDFTHEIWQISPRFHLWNPPKL